MKKIILILATLATIPTFAATMCALNDTVAVVLDPSINGTDSGYDTNTGTWWAQFPYGRVSGVVATLNVQASQGVAVSKLTDTNNGETKRVVGGEKYGRNCWCKMTHPIMSKWVSNVRYGDSGSSGYNACLNTCGRWLRANSYGLRTGMFPSITD